MTTLITYLILVWLAFNFIAIPAVGYRWAKVKARDEYLFMNSPCIEHEGRRS